MVTDETKMNEYQVTFADGQVVEVEAWSPVIARAIAEEETEQDEASIVSVQQI